MSSFLNRPNVDIEKFINKGGGSTNADPLTTTLIVPTDKKRGRPKGSVKDEQPSRVELRIPPKLLEQIDRIVEEHPILSSRHAWLLQAIYDRIAKDSTI